MALPKPQPAIFTLTIPSTGATAKFRAFNVREEKTLILAEESKDTTTILNAIKEIIIACFGNTVDPEKLAMFDIEYIMTQLRAKSVGEVVNLRMPCDADPTHERTPIRIDLTQVKVLVPEGHKKEIPLFDDVVVVMKYPNTALLDAFADMSGTEAVASCIDKIYTKDEVFDSEDQTLAELTEFVESLNPEQFSKIEEQFIKRMPKCEYAFEYSCMVCGHVHKKVIKGLSSFFV